MSTKAPPPVWRCFSSPKRASWSTTSSLICGSLTGTSAVPSPRWTRTGAVTSGWKIRWGRPLPPSTVARPAPHSHPTRIGRSVRIWSIAASRSPKPCSIETVGNVGAAKRLKPASSAEAGRSGPNRRSAEMGSQRNQSVGTDSAGVRSAPLGVSSASASRTARIVAGASGSMRGRPSPSAGRRASAEPAEPAEPALGEPLAQRLQLLAKGTRQPVAELGVVLLDGWHLRPPLLDVHRQEGVHVRGVDVEPVGRDGPRRRQQPHRRLDGGAFAGATLEDPLQHPAVLPEPRPQKAALAVLAEPVDVEDLR